MSTPRFTTKLSNRKVLIIGGSAGLGLSIASGVLEFGGIAIISSSSQPRIDSAVKSLQSTYPSAASRIHGLTIDLATNDSSVLDTRVLQLLEASKAAHNGAPIDHIAFTAGDVVPIAGIETASVETIQRLLQVRVQGAMFVAKHAGKYLAPGPGSSFTLTTGNSKDRPKKGWAMVAGLIGTSQTGLVRGLAVEMAPVRVNLVTIGMTDTEILGKIGISEEMKVRMAREEMLTGRIGSPDDVAEAYLYVMRDANVTGQVITTDGGHLLA